MDVEKVFRMNGGVNATSYAKNSSLQRKVSDKVKDITLEALEEVYFAKTPESFGVADLGCSSGPNTYSIIRAMIEAVERSNKKVALPMPEIRVYLNDLPTNDFNSVFAASPEFYRELRDMSSNVFMAACAGSFYGRLFPSNSLHFVYSSSSLHWLSRVPPDLYDEHGISLNKENIYISETSPPEVAMAYLRQYQEDFSLFLRSRSKEVVRGGKMVLIFLSSGSSTLLWKLLTQSFAFLISQGEVEKEKLDSFEVPYYEPRNEEIEATIKKEGSFEIERLEMFGVEENGASCGRVIAKAIRAIQESMIRSHFGEDIDLDKLFETFAELLDGEIANLHPLNVLLVLKRTDS